MKGPRICTGQPCGGPAARRASRRADPPPRDRCRHAGDERTRSGGLSAPRPPERESPLHVRVYRRRHRPSRCARSRHALSPQALHARRAGPESAKCPGPAARALRMPEPSASLLRIARVVSETTDLTETLRLICRELAHLMGAETVSAYLLDHARALIRPVAAYHVPKNALDLLRTTTL